jgi:hypothetical protein
VTHYEVLGVAHDAEAGEIRRAYLVLARRHHPDFHTTGGDASKESAEVRMRQINAAWQTLGTASSRAAYDDTLLHGASIDTTSGTGTGNGAVMNRPSTAFTPRFADDEDDDDSWRYEPDEGDPTSAPPRLLLMAPPALFVVGLALLITSLSTGIDALSAVGLICLMFSALLFVGAPVVALFRSQISEERSRQRR